MVCLADVKEAEEALTQHEALKKEIEAYAPEYEKMHEYGMHVTEGHTDPQYIFLRERLQGLHKDWLYLQQAWSKRQVELAQALNYQVSFSFS